MGIPGISRSIPNQPFATAQKVTTTEATGNEPHEGSGSFPVCSVPSVDAGCSTKLRGD